MPYHVRPDGTIETDTAEEALRLQKLLVEKPPPKLPKKLKRTPDSKLPIAAIKAGVEAGQIWEARWKSMKGRRIRIVTLLPEFVIPEPVKSAGKYGMRKRITYKMLTTAYKLVS